ncbi:hypothetical protein [Agromyces sp. SYSU T0242]|uniref:hypothetical protein n=1 Tax=Agromyces litoreus TaxID=3158561 RepID=UPI003394672D
MARRRRHDAEPPALSPEDDPYAAYLIWREEREAAARAAAGEDEVSPAPAEPDPVPRGGWLRRLATSHRNAAPGR